MSENKDLEIIKETISHTCDTDCNYCEHICTALAAAKRMAAELAAKDKCIKELEDALELYKDSRERGAIQYEKLEEQIAAKDKEIAKLIAARKLLVTQRNNQSKRIDEIEKELAALKEKIVCCGECVKRNTLDCPTIKYEFIGCAAYWKSPTEDNFYCSRGVRRTV